MNKITGHIIFTALAVFSCISAVSADEVKITTTTTIVNQGDSTPTVTTSTVTGSPEDVARVIANGSTPSSASSGQGSGTSAPAPSSANVPDNHEEDKDLTISGVYKDRQIVPNTMAILCQVSAEDMINDPAKLFNCVNKLVLTLKSENANTIANGADNFMMIRYEELKNLFSMGVQKGITVSQFAKNQKELNKATADSKTEQEDNIIIANSINFLIEVINSMNDLYAERLKSEALEGVENIDATVVKDMIEKSDEKEEPVVAKGGAQLLNACSADVTYTTENPFITEWLWVSNNECVRQICTGKAATVEGLNCKDETETCPDGEFQAKDGKGTAICAQGICIHYESEDFANICDESENLPEISDYKFIDDGQGGITCSDGSKEIACPDGRMKQELGYIVCKGGHCERCLSEATVEGTDSVVMYMNDGQCMKSNGNLETCPDGGPYPTVNPLVCVKCENGNCVESGCEQNRGTSSLDIPPEVEVEDDAEEKARQAAAAAQRSTVEAQRIADEIRAEHTARNAAENSGNSSSSSDDEAAEPETPKPGFLKRVFTKNGRTEYRNWKEEKEYREAYEHLQQESAN